MRLVPKTSAGFLRLGILVGTLLLLGGTALLTRLSDIGPVHGHHCGDARRFSCDSPHFEKPGTLDLLLLPWDSDPQRQVWVFRTEAERRAAWEEWQRSAGLRFPLDSKDRWRVVLVGDGSDRELSLQPVLAEALEDAFAELAEHLNEIGLEFTIVAAGREHRPERGDWVLRHSDRWLWSGSTERPLAWHGCFRDANGLPSLAGPYPGEFHHYTTLIGSLAVEDELGGKPLYATLRRAFTMMFPQHFLGLDDGFYPGVLPTAVQEAQLRPDSWPGTEKSVRRWVQDANWSYSSAIGSRLMYSRGDTVSPARNLVVPLPEQHLDDAQLAEALRALLPHLTSDGGCRSQRAHGIVHLEHWIAELVEFRPAAVHELRDRQSTEASHAARMLLARFGRARRPGEVNWGWDVAAIASPYWMRGRVDWHRAWHDEGQNALCLLPVDFPEHLEPQARQVVGAAARIVVDG